MNPLMKGKPTPSKATQIFNGTVMQFLSFLTGPEVCSGWGESSGLKHLSIPEPVLGSRSTKSFF